MKSKAQPWISNSSSKFFNCYVTGLGDTLSETDQSRAVVRQIRSLSNFKRLF